MTRSEATTVVEGMTFTECPRWFDDKLFFSDTHGNRVMSLDLESHLETVVQVDHPAGIGFMPDGTPLVVAMDERVIWRVDNGTPTIHADLNGFGADFLNDMVVDADGRAYVGCRVRRPGRGAAAPGSVERLLLVHPDGTAAVAAEDVLGPNGSVITPDGSTLIVNETFAPRITAFDRDANGRLSGRRTYADLSGDVLGDGQTVYPDGMCIDEEGAVWVGTVVGPYLRIREGGEITDRVSATADRWAVACALGGPARKTLYLTTVDTTLENLAALRSEAHLHRDHHLEWAKTLAQGYIEAAQVVVAGAGLP